MWYEDLLLNYNSPFPDDIMVQILEQVVPFRDLTSSRKDKAISRKPCGKSNLMKPLTPDELSAADQQIRDLARSDELCPSRGL